MSALRKIRAIAVSGLQEMFDYKIEFRGDSSTAILIAPNGYGKTAFLSVINACLQFRLFDALEHRFDELNVSFDDNTRWSFKRTKYKDEDVPKDFDETNYKRHLRNRRRRESYIKFLEYDELGKAKKGQGLTRFEAIPLDLLSRLIDITLPVSRVTYDTFHDMRMGDVVRVDKLIDRYKDVLLSDDQFRSTIQEYDPGLLEGFDTKLNCVFIETQRLLQTKKASRNDSDANSSAQEEILRQSEHLASLLQKTYASYAATSQELDRSFPNRVVARSERSKSYNIAALKADLEAIEARRAALTEAGILVDIAEPLVAPKDEFIRNVYDALEIYVEDSKKKLSTFDDLFRKVSVFRDLMSKKLKPKTLDIGREFGARVRRESNNVGLDKLSSGEKHEFIMLFKLIFETPPRSMVLIDEPEISLHVSWQLEFMSDLSRIQSANSFQSIIATHSPQIIQGADDITFDLSEQAK